MSRALGAGHVRYPASTGVPAARAEITPVEPDPVRTGEGSAVSDTPAWGIDPVPDRLRVLGTLDTLLLWTNLGVSLLVLVAASYFDLSLKQALLATLVGGLIGNSMLAVAALIGADARVPTMALQRAPLGQRGSYLATALNVLQCLGWSVFEITVIATAAAALSDRVFGFHGTWIWKVVFGGVGLALALLGPIGFVRRFVRKVGIWVVGASIVYLAVWILRNGHVGTLWHRGGKGGSFWLAVDLVIALSVSWIPLVADYTRFSRGRRAAFWGAGLGYLLPTLFQFGFGAILVLSHPNVDGPTAVLTTVAAGGIGSVLALLALTVDETDEAFANVYSTAVSLQNFFPRASQRLLIVGVAVVATTISLGVDLTRYQQFLLLLGAFFVPLFGVLLADWLVAGCHYERDDVFGGPALRPGMVGAWLVGFGLYEWIAQTQDLGFWTRFLAQLHPPHGGIGASLPSFGVAFTLALGISLAARRVALRTYAAARGDRPSRA
jgi:nucleobase:cation symporter-1, NCS1 family